MILESVNPAALPADVAAAWREGLRRGSPEAALTASPEWYRLMAGGDASQGECVAVRADGACVAVLPLLPQSWPLDFRVSGVNLGRRALRILRICGGDLIENGITGPQLSSVWADLFRRHAGVEALWLDHVKEGDRSRLVLDSTRGHPDCFARVLQSRQPHTYARFAPGEAAPARSRNSRRRVERYERALAAQHGEVKLVELRTEAELNERRTAIESLMSRSWQSVWLGQHVDLDAQMPLARAGLVRSFLLTAGGTPVVFLLGYEGHGVLCLHQIGYAQELAGFSPGTVLLSRLMERLAAEGRELVADFGSGEADYKRHFAPDVAYSNRILVVRRTASLHSLLAAYALVRRADRFARWSLDRVGIKAWLVRRAKRSSGT